MRAAQAVTSKDEQKQEVQLLKSKMEVLKKTQAVELKHAKLFAAKEADKLLTMKLGQAKEAYDQEFDQLSKQYQKVNEMVFELKEDKIKLKRKITKQELIIVQFHNLIEAYGKKLRLSDDAKDTANLTK